MTEKEYSDEDTLGDKTPFDDNGKWNVDIEPDALSVIDSLPEEERKAIHEIIKQISEEGPVGLIAGETVDDEILGVLQNWYYHDTSNIENDVG